MCRRWCRRRGRKSAPRRSPRPARIIGASRWGSGRACRWSWCRRGREAASSIRSSATITSVIRFLEARFGVHEPNITPWRRAVSGDLTSMFDFAQMDAWTAVAGGGGAIARADAQAALPLPVRVADPALPRQELGQRPARPLPYDVDAVLDGSALRLVNRGRAGAGLHRLFRPPGAGPVVLHRRSRPDDRTRSGAGGCGRSIRIRTEWLPPRLPRRRCRGRCRIRSGGRDAGADLAQHRGRIRRRRCARCLFGRGPHPTRWRPAPPSGTANRLPRPTTGTT